MFDLGSQIFKNYYYGKNIVPKTKQISPVTDEYVLKGLLNLHLDKSTDIDNIQAKFLKHGALEIKGIITHIIIFVMLKLKDDWSRTIEYL